MIACAAPSVAIRNRSALPTVKSLEIMKKIGTARLNPCPNHNLPTDRGGRHRPDGARHPRRHPSIASATAMCMTVIHTQPERKRQDRSVRCAEKHRRRARTRRLRGLIRPVPAACATADIGWGENCLSSGQNQVILVLDGTLLGDCQGNGHADRFVGNGSCQRSRGASPCAAAAKGLLS